MTTAAPPPVAADEDPLRQHRTDVVITASTRLAVDVGALGAGIVQVGTSATSVVNLVAADPAAARRLRDAFDDALNLMSDEQSEQSAVAASLRLRELVAGVDGRGLVGVPTGLPVTGSITTSTAPEPGAGQTATVFPFTGSLSS